MPVVINPVAKTVSLNVRDLAEEPGFARIGFDREGWTSFALGFEVHQRVFAARLAVYPNYQKEVFVQTTLNIDEWKVTISGRIDGCRLNDSGGHIVEEFKTRFTSEQPRFSINAPPERHRRQLLIYCDLWSRMGNRVASAQLVYVDPESGVEHTVPAEFDAERQAADTQTRLRRMLESWRRAQEELRRKAALADQLSFPHQSPRPGQQMLMRAISDSLETSGHLLAEAPTGSGKTAASLYPALRHSLRTGRQLVFLTSKTLQQEIALRTLEQMNRDGAFRVVQVRAKERMCANDRILCHEDACPYAKNYPRKMEQSKLLDRLLARDEHLGPEKIFSEAKAEQVCPFEVQLEMVRHADAVVADYNYVFDPGAALGHLRDEGLQQAVLLIDEAHNLADRIRGIFSPELLEQDLEKCLEAARNLAPSSRKKSLRRKSEGAPAKQLQFSEYLTEAPKAACDVVSIIEQTLGWIRQVGAKSLPAEKDAIAEIALPHEMIKTLWTQWEREFISYIGWKQREKLAPGDDPLVDFHFALLRLRAVLRMANSKPSPSQGEGGFTAIIERRNQNFRLAALCLDPAVATAQIVRQVPSAIFLSATLRPFDLFTRTLGIQAERVSNLVVPSPFPPENRRILILPHVRTNYKVREQYLPRIAESILEIDAAHDGNKLILFPSYEFLRRVLELLVGPSVSNAGASVDLAQRILTQPPNSSEQQRTILLRAVEDPPPGGVLLMAVLGGMFSEGLDYPGELLEIVAIVSPGLPQVSFERELLRNYFQQRDHNGFEQAYLQPGMTRVIQAAGRLIRNETDRGVIALLCHRFIEHPYVDRLPRDWYRDSPLELISKNPKEDIRKFFAAHNAPNNKPLVTA